VKTLGPEGAKAWIKAGFSALHEDWGSIDEKSVERYQQLVKLFLTEIYRNLHNLGWKSQANTEWNEIMHSDILATEENPNLNETLAVYVVSVYPDVISQFEDITFASFKQLLEPFLNVFKLPMYMNSSSLQGVEVCWEQESNHGSLQ
jgi:hypothetical protein